MDVDRAIGRISARRIEVVGIGIVSVHVVEIFILIVRYRAVIKFLATSIHVLVAWRQVDDMDVNCPSVPHPHLRLRPHVRELLDLEHDGCQTIAKIGGR